MDTCFELHRLIKGADRIPHALRPSFLATAYGIPVPEWAVPTERGCEISQLRNEFFHEGRYGGEPIGFAHPPNPPTIDLQMSAFNARLILGLLGLRCDYVNSRVDTRSMFGLGVPKDQSTALKSAQPKGS
jgi:hypothetical protein